MFAIPGLILLVALIYIRPQEFMEPLQRIPLLYLSFGLAAFGMVLDLRLRKTAMLRTPLLYWAVGLFGWAMLTAAIHTPSMLVRHVLDLGISLILFVIVAHSVQSFRALHVVGGVVLGLVLFVAGIGVHQGFQPTGCVQVDESIPGDTSSGTYDGRPCEQVFDCYLGDAEPGAQYQCEKIGLLGTNSIGKGRVRYRGVLQDPNELALATGIGLPLVFAVGWRKRRIPRWLITAFTVGLVMFCAILTGSRGGQLVVLAVFGAYFVKRFGWKGITVGALMAAPLLLLGGRAGAEAESSTNERIECWYAAISMFRSNPLIGVGFREFNEYHYLTAHNSYLLAVAELGLPGLFLFAVLVYLALKIPFTVLRRYRGPESEPGGAFEGAEVARIWAMALLASYVGLAVGMFFLSFTYHYVLWIYLGLAGALYSATRAHDPQFEVSLGSRELLGIAAGCVGLVLAMYAFTRMAVA